MNNFSGTGAPPTADSTKRVTVPPPVDGPLASHREAALLWFEFGLAIIPILSGAKKPAVAWDPWLDRLSRETIAAHWSTHPDHDVGCIAGDNLIVFDADAPASVAALAELEGAYGLVPGMVVKTSKGEHHYYRRGNDTLAKSDSHSTSAFPDRVDIKTGRALVILPPSTGKTIQRAEARSADELTEASQDFINAIFVHNGRLPPFRHERAERPADPEALTGEMKLHLKALLGHLDPDMGYDDWLRAGMALWTETGGDDDGLELFDSWSSRGTKYPGRREVEIKWRSFARDVEHPIAIGTLIKMVSDGGGDWMDICAAAEPSFDLCETVVVQSGELVADERKSGLNPLDRYSLRGMSDEIERRAVEQVPVLGDLALMGQATIFYAAPNAGKTLLTLNLLCDAIAERRVEARKVYYVNVDDTSQGLAEKLRIADEYGFHMLADGERGFDAGAFLGIIRQMITDDQARGIVVILDTVKKFTDLMDKSKASNFTKVVRRFVTSGGTVIALAHTNKNLRDGKPVYGGTSDVVDDFDCAYTLAPLTSPVQPGEKVVVFENLKRRGSVVVSTAYSYGVAHKIGYDELLASVQPVDEMELLPLKQAAQVMSDVEVISAIEACIRDGRNTKMVLANAVAQRIGVSKRTAIQTIEKYTGDDPAKHRWAFSVRERGAKVFVLLGSAPPLPSNRVTAR